MADLKINQLDSIIPISTGANYSALADNDLFIVKMKIRGTAIGDEDRKLTWADLKSSLNLSQFLQTAGGDIIGDIRLANNVALKGKLVNGAGTANIAYVDTTNSIMVGDKSRALKVVSISYPQYQDATGNQYDFITRGNLPSPNDLSGGGSYTKSDNDTLLSKKFDKVGGDLSGNLNMQNYQVTSGTTTLLRYVNNSVSLGDKSVDAHITSKSVPTWWSSDTTSSPFVTYANLPTPDQLGLTTTVNKAASALQDGAFGIGTVAQDLTSDQLKSTSRPSEFFKTSDTTVYGSSGFGFRSQSQDGDWATVFIGTDKIVRSASMTAKTLTVQKIFSESNPPTAAQIAGGGVYTQAQIDAKIAAYLPLTGGKLTGNLTVGTGLVYGGKTTDYININSDDGYTKLASSTGVLSVVNTSSNQIGNLTAKGDIAGTQWGNGYLSDFLTKTYYSQTQGDARYARSGVNNDITSLNALTGALKVGSNAINPLEVTTLQQVQALTSGTAGAVVGVVGGFIGAVMWFNGTRATIPAGWVAADGTLLNRADYPDLWAAVQSGALQTVGSSDGQSRGKDSDWLGIVTGRGAYSYGDGSKTFRLPDLNGKQTDSIKGLFLRGDGMAGQNNNETGGSVGVIRPSAAPNITGFLGAAGAGVFNTNNTSGVFYTGESFPQYAQGVNGSGASASVRFDASRSSSVYGSNGATEVRPNSVQGIWIIRASNNFEAANTQFSVNNGASSLPASGTNTSGGNLRSVYSVGGIEDHSLTLSSTRTVSGTSNAILTVIQQKQGSQPFQSADFVFGSDGVIHTSNLVFNTDAQKATFKRYIGSDTLNGMSGGRLTDGSSVNLTYTAPSPKVGDYLNSAGFATTIAGRGVTNGNLGATFGLSAGEHVGTIGYGLLSYQGFGDTRYWNFFQDGTATGVAWNTSSDERLKDKIKTLENPLATMSKFRGCSWEMKTQGNNYGMGFIAQSVGKVFPEMVHKGSSIELDNGEIVDNALSINAGQIASGLHHEALLSIMSIQRKALLALSDSSLSEEERSKALLNLANAIPDESSYADM